ncbi:protein of unknown function (plasmid) [Caballeronia sp. S22]
MSRLCCRRVEGAFGFVAGSRVRVGLLALPLCGAAVTFFAAAKKVTKESSYPQPKHFTPAAAQAIGLMARQ